MTDLRLAEDFWPAYEAAGNASELARRFDLPTVTVREWKRHHAAGHIFYKGHWVPQAEVSQPQKTADLDLTARLQSKLKSTRRLQTVESLADFFDVPPRAIREALAELKDKAVLVNLKGDEVSLGDEVQPTYTPEIIDFRKYREIEVPIGVTADNHIGSKYERMDVLETAFERWQAQGVQTVYQVGNIIDGERRGINENDVYVHGFEDQVVNLIQKWPSRPGITTYFITGQCHEGWYIKQNKINVGKRIDQEARDQGRTDLRFLGHLEHDLLLEQDAGNAKVRLFHAGGGSAYATSYKPQKIVESYQGGEKPQALLIGHYHKYDTGYPREVWEAQCACTQDQTPWMRQHNIAAHVGFLTIWIRQNELGLITGWKVEFSPFYDRKFYMHKW